MIRPAGVVVFLAASVFLATAVARAQSPPPAPEHYFNDYAGVVAPDVAARLDEKLKAFDEQTSSQIVVAVFPELPSASLEDFTVRAAQAWRVGRKKLDNGAVLFVFVKDRKVRIETGYGLEGALPDATAHRIIVLPRPPRSLHRHRHESERTPGSHVWPARLLRRGPVVVGRRRLRGRWLWRRRLRRRRRRRRVLGRRRLV